MRLKAGVALLVTAFSSSAANVVDSGRFEQLPVVPSPGAPTSQIMPGYKVSFAVYNENEMPAQARHRQLSF